MNKTVTLSIGQRFIFLILCMVIIPIVSIAQFRYTTNTVALKNYTITSKALGENRKISIYRPEVFPEYSNVIPPVVYLLDGEAYINFFANMINMVCERFVQVPPITVVAIENYVDSNSDRRNRDFEDPQGIEQFIRFIDEEVIPFAEKGYNKKPFRVISGHSSGANFAIRMLVKKSDVFDGYLLSSFRFTEQADLKVADSVFSHLRSKKYLFFSDADEARCQVSGKKVDSLLRHKNHKDLYYKITHYPTESHYSVFLRSYYDGFRYLFKIDPTATLKNPKDMTIGLLRQHYKNVSEIYGVGIKPPETITGGYADLFLNVWHDIEKALDFLKENADNYSENPWLHFIYAEALLKKGDKKNALISYEKVLQLNPNDEKAKQRADMLKSELR